MVSGKKADLDFTIIDFETSGLDPKVEQIIEASIIRVRKGNPVMTFNTLVELREGIQLSNYVTDLTGHHAADLEDAISESQLADVIWALLNGEKELIVAHNALFDLSFLQALYDRQSFGVDITNDFIDSLTIARDREPYPHKLGDCCKRNGIELVDAHSAEADTFALLDLIVKYHLDKDISEWVNIAGYRPKYGEPAWYPENATLKKQGAETVSHGMTKPVKPKTITSRVVTTSNKKKKVPGGEPGDLP